MHYFPITEECRRVMLKEIGVEGFSDLLRSIPRELPPVALSLPDALSELEASSYMEALADRNVAAANIPSFLGAGAYEHFIPAAINAITSRGEFATAYTPYQAEASQGTLEALFEYQTMICELTGLSVSNASLYDGASSLAEACLVALNATKRNAILAADTVHPEYRDVMATYVRGAGKEMRNIPHAPNGLMNRSLIESMWTEDVAAVVVQTPNFFGLVESLDGFASWLHERATLLIISAHPISLAYFKSPGEYGADMAVGELQPMGMPLSYGGPYAGYFTATNALVRKVPGRICGQTVDAEGARAFTLTLQAREQHIRREKASSNICTNQALMALRATVYMSLMGKKGLRRVAELNLENAYYLRDMLSRLAGVSCPYDRVIFNEFVIRTKRPAVELLDKLRAKKVLGGVALRRWYPGRENDLLICVTETKTKEELDRYAEAVSEVL